MYIILKSKYPNGVAQWHSVRQEEAASLCLCEARGVSETMPGEMLNRACQQMTLD